MSIFRWVERAKHSLCYGMFLLIVPFKPKILYLRGLKTYPNNCYAMCENHWLCSLSKVYFMKHVCLNIWLWNSQPLLFPFCLCAMNNSLYHATSYSYRKLLSVWNLSSFKRIISKSNYYTFHDCAIFWNYPSSKVMRHSICCVSLVPLA